MEVGVHFLCIVSSSISIFEITRVQKGVVLHWRTRDSSAQSNVVYECSLYCIHVIFLSFFIATSTASDNLWQIVFINFKKCGFCVLGQHFHVLLLNESFKP